MNILDSIKEKINESPYKIKIILPEGTSEKIQQVAMMLKETNVEPILVYERVEDVPTQVARNNINYLVIAEQDLDDLANYLVEIRNGKMSIMDARNLIRQPNYFATTLVKKGLAHGMVGGITYDTKDIIKPALQIIKTKPNVRIASTYFLMIREQENYIFTDCAMNVDPSSEDLADIAYLAYDASQILGFENPQMVFLSYSTKGSGAGESVDKVLSAHNVFKKKWKSHAKNCIEDGEFQFDAAWDENVRKVKAPTSSITKRADIYVFPDLNSANIGYKIAQRLGGFKAVGPIVVGLDRPVNDLSRGASIDDIFNTIMVTAYSYLYDQQKN